jgi:hypothetical protein
MGFRVSKVVWVGTYNFVPKALFSCFNRQIFGEGIAE